jgi:hypothetical protein
MKNDVRDTDGNDALLGKSKAMHSSSNIVNKLLQTTIASETYAGARYADSGDRRLTATLKKDWINDVHF